MDQDKVLTIVAKESDLKVLIGEHSQEHESCSPAWHGNECEHFCHHRILCCYSEIVLGSVIYSKESCEIPRLQHSLLCSVKVN